MKRLLKLQEILLLNHFYPIKLEYTPNNKTTECRFHYPYQSITIKYSNEILEYWNNKEYDQVLFMLTHEMCHPLTDALYDTCFDRFIGKETLENEREKLTDHIANIVLRNGLI